MAAATLRFKIDENLPTEIATLLREAGHDAQTILDQRMGGADDSQIAEACRSETRVLITLDAGFADIRNYPPRDFAGVIVLRTDDQQKARLLSLFRRVLSFIGQDRLLAACGL